MGDHIKGYVGTGSKALTDQEIEAFEMLIDACDEHDALPWYKKLFTDSDKFVAERVTEYFGPR